MTQIHVTNAQTDEILDSISEKFWDDLHVQNLEDNVETFDFKTLPELSAAQHLSKRNRIIIPGEDGDFREFIIDEHIKQLDDISVYCTASYLELSRSKPIEPGTYPGLTPKTALELILSGTGWSVGRAEYASTSDLVLDSHTNPLAALRDAAKLLDRELSFRVETNGYKVTGRYVDMVERQGEWRGREIVSGKDLINAKRRETTDSVVSALIGLGPTTNGSNRIVVEVTDADARQRWGRSNQHLWDVYKPEFDKEPEFVTQADVEQATREELDRRINAVVQYEVTSVDLESIFGRDHEKIRIGDSVRIKATEYEPPLYMDARVIAVESSIREGVEKKYVLGEFIEYSAEDIERLRNEFRDFYEETRGIHYGPTPPDDLSKLWIDTTYEPYRVMVYSYDEELWKRATPVNAIEVGAEIETHKGVMPPSDTRKLWIDTSAEPNVLKQYDVTQGRWVKVTPTQADEVGAETPDGAQDKADQAEEKAKEKSVAEKFRAHLLTIERSDDAYDDVYTSLKANPYLNDSTTLDDAMTLYNVAYDALHASITNAVADDIVSQSELDDITAKILQYQQQVGPLEVAFEDARSQIADLKVDEAIVDAGDYTDLTDQLIREDLRLEAPLPTSITMDESGITATTSDPTKYARLDYRGIYVHNGALMIVGGLVESQLATEVANRITEGVTAKSTLDEKVPGWDDVKSTVETKAPDWDSTTSTVNLGATGWEAATSTVNSKESDWDAAKATIDDKEQIWDSKANGTYIDSSGVYTGTVLANQLVASKLSAITADLGTVTAGLIRGVTFETSSASNKVVIKNNTVTSYESNGSFGTDVATMDSGKVRVAEAGTTSNVTMNSNQIEFGNGGKLHVDSNGFNVTNALDHVNIESTAPGGEVRLKGDVMLQGSLMTNQLESGWCGTGGVPSGMTGPVSLVGVNFRIKKNYTPSSVTFTTTTSNRTPKFTEISSQGFSLYVEGEGSTGSFVYWRGYYTA
jgi:phage minor structural protein